MATKKTDTPDTKVQVAPVDKYDERPNAQRSVEENVLAEGRHLRVDQIADYHDENPTLDPESIPAQADITAAVQADALKTAKKAADKGALADAVEAVQVNADTDTDATA